MISIENANLEQAMASLFSRMCLIPVRVGRAIYLTPKSAIARLDIFKSAAKAALSPSGDEEHRKQLKIALTKANRLAERAKSLIGKRHGIIHDAWGFNKQTGQVERYLFSNPTLEQAVPLESLERVIEDFRQLIGDVWALNDQFRENPPTLVDMRLRSPGKTS